MRCGTEIKCVFINIQGLFASVAEGQMAIDNLCLACGESDCNIKYPLFKESLRQDRARNFVENVYTVDENGFQSQCIMCT